MTFQRALIFAILSLAAISVFSVEGLKCKDYPVGDHGTVRVCDETEQDSESNYFPTAENSGRPAHRFAPHLYDKEPIWPTPEYREQVIAKSIPPPPYMIRALENYEAEQRFRNSFYKRVEPHVAREVAQPFQEQKLDTLVEEVSEVKNSVKNLATYLKSILDNVVVQTSEQPREEKVNVNFKLDPSLEAILKQFLQLMEQKTAEKSDEPSSTESNESAEDSSVDLSLVSLPSEEHATTETDTTSDENTTVQQEEDSTEQSSNEYDRTMGELNTWISEHFGPSVNEPNSDEEIEELFNETSEDEENSPEKSEESFETWFNNVYRRISTEAPTTEDNNTEETTYDYKESNEDTANDSNENIKSAEDSNDKKDYDVDTSKSNEENKVSNDYDTVFVPNFIDSSEQVSNPEYLAYAEHGDRYGYAAVNDDAHPEEWNFSDCLRLRISVKNFDDEELRRAMSKCIAELSSRARKNEEASTEINVDATASKETPATNSNESKDSSETETPAPGSYEMKESSETEAAVTDSGDEFGYSNDDDNYDWLKTY